MATSQPTILWEDAQAVTIMDIPQQRLCGLGMRPEHLTHLGQAIYYPSNQDWYNHMHKCLVKLVGEFLSHYDFFQVISNLTLGFDTALAETALKHKLPLTVATPFKEMSLKWKSYHKARYRRLLNKAEHIYLVSHGAYKAWYYPKAVQHKLRKSDFVLVLWQEDNFTESNSYKALKKHNLDYVNLWQDWEKMGLV